MRQCLADEAGCSCEAGGIDDGERERVGFERQRLSASIIFEGWPTVLVLN